MQSKLTEFSAILKQQQNHNMSWLVSRQKEAGTRATINSGQLQNKWKRSLAAVNTVLKQPFCVLFFENKVEEDLFLQLILNIGNILWYGMNKCFVIWLHFLSHFIMILSCDECDKNYLLQSWSHRSATLF